MDRSGVGWRTSGDSGMLFAPRLAITLYVIETVFCCLGLEVALFVRERKSIHYRSLATGLLTAIGLFIVWRA